MQLWHPECPIANEFVDELFEDFLEVPPNQDVEFVIKMGLGMNLNFEDTSSYGTIWIEGAKKATLGPTR